MQTEKGFFHFKRQVWKNLSDEQNPWGLGRIFQPLNGGL